MTTTHLAHDDDLAARFARDAVPAIDGLYRHAFTLTRDRNDAEDLLQDTAARAYAGFGSFQPGTNLSGWLYRIMVNAHLNNRRRQQHRPTLSFTAAFSRSATPPNKPWSYSIWAKLGQYLTYFLRC